jgi:hypothetical protein
LARAKPPRRQEKHLKEKRLLVSFAALRLGARMVFLFGLHESVGKQKAVVNG